MRLNFGRNTDDYPLNLNYDVFIPDSSSPWWEDTHCCFHSRSMWDTLRLPSMSSINFDGGINGFSAYQQIMYQSHSVLAGNEINFVNNFYSHPDYLYSGKPWWHYFCVSENDFIGNYLKFELHGHTCGEEFRMELWQSICQGSKGIGNDMSAVKIDTSYKKDTFGNGFYNACDQSYYDNALITPNDSLIKQLIYTNYDGVGEDYLSLPISYHNGSDALNFGDYIDFDSTAKHWGVPKDRLYIGRRSLRTESYKLFSYLKTPDVDSTIMKLRLCSFYNKGIRNWHGWDIARFGDNDPLTKFISYDYENIIYSNPNDPKPNTLPSQYIKSRPIGRINSNGTPFYEPFDSSFFMISMLRDSSDQNATSNEIYLGLQNKRTSPLFIYNDTVRFFSSAEFDDSCGIGYPNYSSSYTSTWKPYFWKRGGARELSIPFNYTSSNPSEYCLLKVQELGANDSTLNAQPWRQAAYYHRVDTVIGQDKFLTVRLLPGEGKILKVTVLHQPSTIKASLNYQNQRKLVAYPIYKAGQATDTVRYHLAYHWSVSNDSNVVAYKRSAKIWMKSDTENIKWEPAIVVSKNFTFCDTVTHSFSSITCQYPSIVVRPAPNGVERAYIIYNCYYNATSNNLHLVLSVIDSVNSDTIRQLKKTVVYSDICIPAIDFNKWGIPSIGQLYDKNIITWNDPAFGIRYATIDLDSLCDIVVSSGVLKFNEVASCYNPSVSTYSRSSNMERECGLIWREHDAEESSSDNIIYTRITDSLFHRLPPNMAVYYPYYQYNVDTTLVKLTDQAVLNACPVIYRGIEPDVTPIKATRDYMAWEEFGPLATDLCNPPIATNQISTMYITNIDTLPDVYQLGFCSYYNSLGTPEVTQGDFIKNSPGSFIPNLSDRAAILEYTEYDVCGVWHNLITNWQIGYYNKFDNGWQHLAHNGSMQHLAARPKFLDTNGGDWWTNRRVYQDDNYAINTAINVSSQMFYKQNVNNEAIPLRFLGYKDKKHKSTLSEMFIDDKKIKFDLDYLFPELCDTCHQKRNRNKENFTDSILTQWFKVDEHSILELMNQGYDDIHGHFYVQKKSTLSSQKIFIHKSTDSTLVHLHFDLVNGQGDEYRLLFIRKGKKVLFTDNIVFTPSPFKENANKLSITPQSIVYLNETHITDKNDLGLSIFPNPADNILYLKAYLPQSALYSDHENTKIKVKIVSALGSEMFVQEVKPGQTIAVPTADFPVGAYFIRAEDTALFNIVNSASQSIMIQR
ncbi:MAG: hypothetical protein NT007_00020 [Candidatus Kapabacteria bacterium]|nr:hypothetical protein [Candidatus Kapabacteria bacterium]